MASKVQQGDCIFKPIPSLPEGCIPIKPTAKGYVLAEGETTGHSHVIEHTEDVELYEKDGVLYVRTKVPTVVTHEEHKAVPLEAEVIYRVDHVIEENPFEREKQRVKD